MFTGQKMAERNQARKQAPFRMLNAHLQIPRPSLAEYGQFFGFSLVNSLAGAYFFKTRKIANRTRSMHVDSHRISDAPVFSGTENQALIHASLRRPFGKTKFLWVSTADLDDKTEVFHVNWRSVFRTCGLSQTKT